MADASAPNLVDYLTLAAAVLSPIVAALVTVWSTRRTDRERFDLHIDWEWRSYAEVAEFPVLHVHNKMASNLIVTEISIGVGALWRKRVFGTALYWEDPGDIPFPAEVKAGQIRAFRLDEHTPRKRYKDLSSFERWLGSVGRSGLLLRVVTGGKSARLLPAERLLPWSDRPKWLLKKEGDPDA